jgi:hypothetical protein
VRTTTNKPAKPPRGSSKPGKKEAPKQEAKKPRKFSGGPLNRLTLVRSMIRRLKSELESGEGTSKSGVAELIRLIALEKELSGETEHVREIRVTWVEPRDTELLNAA